MSAQNIQVIAASQKRKYAVLGLVLVTSVILIVAYVGMDQTARPANLALWNNMGAQNKWPNKQEASITSWFNKSVVIGDEKDSVDYSSFYGTTFLEKKRTFLPEYKNPCWKEHGEFYCIPYFYLLGVTKCGTTDLSGWLKKHPQISKKSLKEIQWWDTGRCRHLQKQAKFKHMPGDNYLKKKAKFESFLDSFRRSSSQIKKNRLDELICFDGTPRTLYNIDCWEQFPGNEGLAEPKYVTAHHMKQLNPKQKFIVIFRNPVTRAYSEYRFINAARLKKGYNISAAKFEEEVEDEIEYWQNCFSQHSVRQCAYGWKREFNIGERPHRIRMHLGMYVVFLRDWLSVFPQNQILVLRLEDYGANRAEYLQKIADFLDIEPYPDKMLKKSVNTKTISNKGKHKYEPMSQRTIKMLEDFYKPFNTQLAELLQDSRFSWDND